MQRARVVLPEPDSPDEREAFARPDGELDVVEDLRAVRRVERDDGDERRPRL